jgi:type II secretory ATPase GspE/PulE/Tfp pilus assembly ATPase PilB-like protein
MITLRRAGEELVRSGATTLAEVHRVVDAEEEMM